MDTPLERGGITDKKEGLESKVWVPRVLKPALLQGVQNHEKEGSYYFKSLLLYETCGVGEAG